MQRAQFAVNFRSPTQRTGSEYRLKAEDLKFGMLRG
jgi:hypothetical protein